MTICKPAQHQFELAKKEDGIAYYICKKCAKVKMV
jgi:hypothetical protein